MIELVRPLVVPPIFNFIIPVSCASEAGVNYVALNSLSVHQSKRFLSTRQHEAYALPPLFRCADAP